MFILKALVRWIVLSAAVVLAEYLIPGIHLSGTVWITALAVGLVLGFINVFVKPVLTILTIPISLITLGLFGFILNALLFWATAYFVPAFTISGFLPALLGSIVVSVVMWIEHLIF
jgi:putative membrane protein